MKAIVTGADGYIGSHLCAELETLGLDVSAMGLHVPDGVNIDLRDGPEVVRHIQQAAPEVIFHLGGVSGPMVSPDDPSTVASINCSGTVNVFEGARTAQSTRVIYASSVSGFDGGDPRAPIPLTIYGATKRFGEMVAEVYHRDFGITTVSARIGSVYGHGRRTLDVLDLMIKQAREHGIVSYSPDAIVPLISVVDLARSLARLGTMSDPPLVCDLVTETLTERSLAHLVAQSHGVSEAAVVAGEIKSASFPEWRKSLSPALLLDEPTGSVAEALDGL